MSNEINSDTHPGEPMAYEIRIRGHLGRQWTEWSGGLDITLEDSDQAALHGLLRKVRDLGMPPVFVQSR